jgi:hypothetical protein
MPSEAPARGRGRPPGMKNKATIERELRLSIEREIDMAAMIDAAKAGRREMAKDVLARAMIYAEGATGNYRPKMKKETGRDDNPDGDHQLFGQWFDRWVFCAKEVAKYQSPQIKSVDAPTPAPDPRDLEAKSRKRFGLRVFEGGKEV